MIIGLYVESLKPRDELGFGFAAEVVFLAVDNDLIQPLLLLSLN
jgi:hypothetical protein